MSHAPLLIADAEGYFAEQNLEVEFVRLADPNNAMPMLLDGGVDVLTGGPTPAILNAMARGLPVRAVAEKGYLRAQGCSRAGLVIRKPLLEAANGGVPAVRRISMDKAPQQLYLVEKMLAAAGLRMSDLDQKFVLHAPEMEALADGTLDAALAGEPWLTLNLERGHVVQWVRAEDVLPDAQLSFIYFGPNLLERDVSIGARFLAAYLKGVRLYEEGKTERNLELLARVTGDGQEMIEKMCWPAFVLDGRIDYSALRDFQQWAIERDLVEAVVEEAEFWDPKYLKAANDALSASRMP
jgi:NitT/TauT family transport system substrate-binding protein